VVCDVHASGLKMSPTQLYEMGAGNSWAHQATTRIILYWEGEQRRAHLYKSPSLPATTVDLFVTDAGIRGRKTQKRTRE
jgi:RAD51-like protein 2